MKFFQRCTMGVAVCCLALAAGCAQKEDLVLAAKEPAVPITGIAVLPVRPVIEADDGQPVAGEKMLLDGSQVMNDLMKEMLAGKSGIRFVAEPAATQGRRTAGVNLETARRIAAQQGCNVVLETTLSRYNERVGSEYGVKQPAAVTFAYRLYEVGDGRVLCHGRFDEQQKSLMENLLALPKAQSRGLVWLTAEELARDGLQEKLGECPYLGEQ